MKYRTIPGTDLTPSVICYGSVFFGSRIPEEETFRLLDTYVERGGNFIDTAKVYADWLPGERSASEKTIGRWLRSRGNRESIVLATKGAHPELGRMDEPRMSRESIVHDVDSSLSHLQTDRIDLYYLHRDDPATPAGEIIESLNEVIRAGKVRYIGCSNWTAARIEEANRYASERGLQGFAANQPMWSLADPNEDQMSDKTMVVMHEDGEAFHRRTGMAVVPYTSQAFGFFSGQYRRDNMPDKLKLFVNEENLRRLERVERTSARLGISQTETALGYLLSQPFPVFPIIGSRTQEQLEESLKAGDVTLDPETVRYLRYGDASA